MNENIQLKNKLLAEYMGFTYYPHDKNSGIVAGWAKYPISKIDKRETQGFGLDVAWLCRTHNQLKFHYDWNWLIPVVQKIHKQNVVSGSLTESYNLIVKLSLETEPPLCIFNICSSYVELLNARTIYENNLTLKK